MVVSDAEFMLSSTDLGSPERNIILYGNAETNLAWDAVLDGERSRIYEQAANRAHVQKALLMQLLK